MKTDTDFNGMKTTAKTDHNHLGAVAAREIILIALCIGASIER